MPYLPLIPWGPWKHGFRGKRSEYDPHEVRSVRPRTAQEREKKEKNKLRDGRDSGNLGLWLVWLSPGVLTHISIGESFPPHRQSLNCLKSSQDSSASAKETCLLKAASGQVPWVEFELLRESRSILQRGPLINLIFSHLIGLQNTSGMENQISIRNYKPFTDHSSWLGRLSLFSPSFPWRHRRRASFRHVLINTPSTFGNQLGARIPIQLEANGSWINSQWFEWDLDASAR